MNHQNKILAALVCIFIYQSSAKGQSISRSDFLRESQQADRFGVEGHWDIAKNILLRLVASPYAREHEYTELAYCYLNALPGKTEYSLAERYARKALSLNPEAGHACAALAELAIERNDYEGSIQLATRALNCKPPDKYAGYLRARCYVALHKYNEALRDLEQWDICVTKTDKSQTTVKMQGEILEKMGSTDAAIKKYKADSPYHPEQATKNVVRCLQKEGKYREAIVEVSTLIKRNAEDSDAYNLRASLKAQAKDWKGAIADYDHAINLSPTSTYYKNRAQAYEALGQTKLAKQDLANAEKSSF